MSSPAKLNVIVKEAAALEALARVRSATFDKTGTLTRGEPTVVEIREDGSTQEEILRLAGAAEQYSVHVFTAPILEEARRRGLVLPEVAGPEEVATNGV